MLVVKVAQSGGTLRLEFLLSCSFYWWPVLSS